MKMMGQYVWVAALLCVTIASVTAAVSDSTLELKFYPMSKSKWTDTKAQELRTLVATDLTSYCDATPSACGLASTTTFSSSNVVIASTEDDSKSMKLSFYVEFPAGASTTSATITHVLLTALEAILKTGRDSVRNVTGAYVTYIGSDYYGIPVESEANAIIIPIAVIVVVAVGIVAFVLVKWQVQKERQGRINNRLMEKKKYGTTHTMPSYNILDATNSTTLTTTTPRHGTHSNKVAPDNCLTYHSEKEQMGAKSAAIDHVTPRSDGSADKKNGVLPPLQERNTEEEERKERKRLKKERKRERWERRKLQENGMDLEVYDNQGMDTSNLTQGMDTSNLTDTDSKSYDPVPTFSVEKPVV